MCQRRRRGWGSAYRMDVPYTQQLGPISVSPSISLVGVGGENTPYPYLLADKGLILRLNFCLCIYE